MRTTRSAVACRRLAWVLLVLVSTLLSGCGRLSDYAKIVEGNRLHERGDYQGAILSYLGARRGDTADGASGISATIDYDVANVYARQGEYAAAAELYAAAEREGSGAIVADSYFNDGVALFEQGRYEDSWKAFRAALDRLEPSSAEAAEARRNLELAWRAWKKRGQSPPRVFAAASQGSPGPDESELRLLQRLETGRWRPGSAVPAPPSSSDY